MIAYRQNHATLQVHPKPERKRRRRDPRPRLDNPKGAVADATDLLDRIAATLEHAGVGEADFGRLATRDPNLVGDLYAGRKIRAGTRARIITALEQIERGTRNG